MAKVRKVYLPRWVAWFGQLFAVPIWLFITYQVFFTAKGRAEVGLTGWILLTVVLGALSVMLFLMGYRKLPAYLIEEED